MNHCLNPNPIGAPHPSPTTLCLIPVKSLVGEPVLPEEQFAASPAVQSCGSCARALGLLWAARKRRAQS